ncbi:MAG TPA: hypothetical protein VGG19_20400 [Tepidisphaeraceae bacterium]|jgi:hypothetical protein
MPNSDNISHLIPGIPAIIDRANRLRIFPTPAAAREIQSMLHARINEGMTGKQISALVKSVIIEHMGPAPKVRGKVSTVSDGGFAGCADRTSNYLRSTIPATPQPPSLSR